VGLDASNRTLLMIHDGELADVKALAESIGVQVIEGVEAGATLEWDVLVTSARYAKSEQLAGARMNAVRIAVLDRNSRTLRTLLRRSGVDLVVRRPVHPAALRLLLVHALYRGPERRTRRVAVGAPVRFRLGLLKRDGTLADLSMRGCLLLSRHNVRVGQRVAVWVPDPATDGRSFSLRGSVVRTMTTDSGERGFGVDFGKVEKALVSQLKAAVTAHLDGPAAGSKELVSPAIARAHAAPPETPTPDAGATQPISYKAAGSVRREVVHAPAGFGGALAPDAANGVADAVASQDADERRRAERHVLPGRRVVALGEQAARVLIGRDLSVGGMRVDRAPNLQPGQVLQLAIHVTAGETPLVVRAEILRDDGERGFALRFCNLSTPAERYLAKMVSSLPVLEAGDGLGHGIVVSEIIDPPA
jgi:PilZ domain